MEISGAKEYRGGKLASFIFNRIKDGEERVSEKSRIFDELNTLLNFSRELHSIKSYLDIGKLIFKHLQNFYFSNRLSGYLATYNIKYDEFQIVYEFIKGDESKKEYEVVRLKEVKGIDALAIEKQETVFVYSNKSEKVYEIEPEQKYADESSIVVVPLINNLGLVGLFRLICEPAHSIDEKFVEFIESVCNFMSVAIAEKQNEEIADKTLRDSQRVISNLIKNLPGIAYRCFNDKEWTMQFVSDGCFDLTGYEPSELLYNSEKSFADLIVPEDREYVWVELQKSLRERKTFEIVFRIIDKDNNVKWVLNKGMGVISNEKGHLFIEGFIVDITDQKRAELEREVLYLIGESIHRTRNLEELLSSIHENIKKLMYAENCSIALYDKFSDTISFVYYVDKYSSNPGLRKLSKGKTEYVLKTGKPLLLTEENLKQLISDNVIEDKAKRAKSWLGVPLYAKSEIIGVLALKHYNDENIYSERDKNLLMTIANQASYAIERKLYEIDRNKIEQRFRLIWDKCSEGFRLVDENGITIMVNDAYCKIFQKSRDELLGKHFALVYSPDARKDIRKKFSERLFTGEIQSNCEKEITLWNDKKIWVRVSNSILLSENDPLMVLSIFNEVTEEKKLQLNLIQSQKMESTGRLAGGIAHDFNNLLTVIIGSSEMIGQNAKENEKIYKCAARIRIAAQRGSDLAKQLLSFARLDKYSVKPLSINQVISDTLKLIYQTFEKTIEIKTNLRGNLPLIDGDYNHLQQVFMNLCINARDTMNKCGTLTIESTLVRVTDAVIEKPKEFPAGDYVMVTVADTGHGMTEEVMQHIFEPFFTTKDNSRGTGLGLSIVYGIVRSHRGFIIVESQVNVGTKFKVHFPVSESQRVTTEIKQEEELIGGSETILLIDDDDMVLETGKELLRSIGYNIITASSVISATEFYKLKKEDIALVIIDLSMPKVNGVDLFNCLKRINPEIKALIASGSMDNETYDEIIKQGVNGIILKPYDLKKLSKAVRQILDRK